MALQCVNMIYAVMNTKRYVFLLCLLVAMSCRGEEGERPSPASLESCKDGHAFFVKDTASGTLLRYKYTDPSLDNDPTTHTTVFTDKHLPDICWDSFGYQRCNITYISGVDQSLIVAFPVVGGVALTRFSGIGDSDDQLMYRNDSVIDFSQSNCQPIAVFDVTASDHPIISFCITNDSSADQPSLRVDEINIDSSTIIGSLPSERLEFSKLPSQLLWLDASDCKSIFFLDGFALKHWSIRSSSFGPPEDLGCETTGRLEQFSDDKVIVYCVDSPSERSVVSDACVGDRETYEAAVNGTLYPCSAGGGNRGTSVRAFNGSVFLPSVNGLTISQPPGDALTIPHPPGDIVACVSTDGNIVLVSVTPSRIHLTQVGVDGSSVRYVTINGSNPRLHDETFLSFIDDGASSAVINLACDVTKPVVTINSSHELALFVEGRNRYSCRCPLNPDPTPTSIVTLAPSSVLPSVTLTPSNPVTHNNVPRIVAPIIVGIVVIIFIFIAIVVVVFVYRCNVRKTPPRQATLGSENGTPASRLHETTTPHTVSHEQSGYPAAVQNGGTVKPSYDVPSYSEEQKRIVEGQEEDNNLQRPLPVADSPHNGRPLVVSGM